MTDRIENTRERDPMLHLLGVMSQGQSGYIEDMEADGQRQLVNSMQLPRKGPWDELTALGFVRGEDRDDLFCDATLPEGWRKEGSDHAMWSYIVDTRGIRMVGVFYKAAFYDRSAHMNLQNAGYTAASEVIYGDGPVALPEQWAVFTESERAAFKADLDMCAEDAKRHPNIYGKYMSRVAEGLTLMNAAMTA